MNCSKITVGFLFLFGLVTLPAFSQNIDKGIFDDFDYGPHGVYGARSLDNTKYKEFWKLSAIDKSTALAVKFNEAGVKTNSLIVSFKNGVLSHVEEVNQWGDTIRYKTFQPLGNDSFQVTHLLMGNNQFLPGKYAIDVYRNELLVEESFHSGSGKLKDNWRGYSTIRYQRYDDKNRFSQIKESAFYNSKNMPVIVTGRGYFKIKNEYDEKDHLISEAFFNKENQSMAIRSGQVSNCKYFFNNEEQMVHDEYFGLNGQPATNENGIASIEHEYDRGFEIKETRKDASGQISRSAVTGDGIAIIKSKFDDKGNKLMESYFDEKDHPIDNHAGYHRLLNTFSKDNMLLEVAYFDVNDLPGVDRDSIHAVHYSRDAFGRVTEEYLTDLSGNRIKDFEDEVYLIRTKYNHLGKQESRTFWADSLTPMPRWNGVYKTSYKYDSDGSLAELNNYDQNGSLMKTADGSSTVQMFYQEDGHIFRREFLFNGSLVTRTDGVSSGYAVIRYEYDSAGRPLELGFYGPDHEAINATISVNDEVTAHRIVFIWKYARLVEEWYYKMNDNEPFLKLDCLKNDFLGLNGISTGRKNAN